MEFDDQRDRRLRAGALIVFFATGAVFGILDGVLSSRPSWDFTSYVSTTLIVTGLVLTWCIADARIRRYPLTRGLTLLIFLISLVGLAAYLVKTRGWKPSLKLGLGLPAFLIWEALYIVSYTLCERLFLPA